MLLVDWVRSLGLPFDARRLQLGMVQRFVFGERYAVEMADGRVYEDADLDRMLQMVHDEFMSYNVMQLLHKGEVTDGCYMKLQIGTTRPTARDPLGQNSDRVLEVIPVSLEHIATAGSVAENIERIRQAVTFYNLSGDWTQYHKENL